MPSFNDIEISNINEINEYDRKSEFRKLVNTIDLNQIEKYDCSNLNVWSYRNKGDIRDGVNITFGNMVKGFPLKVGGVMFNHSEGAYIAGKYSKNDHDCIRIQNMISADRKGLWCKKIFRGKLKYTKFGREDFNDFYDFNVQWMMYVLWMKSVQNENFAGMLKNLPIDSHVVENTTHHYDETAIFWGAKNQPLEDVRKLKKKEIAKNGVFKTKVELKRTQMLAVNAINDIGVFEGKNVMGKIIKLMSLSLIYGQEPPIDYDLLERKRLFMVGQPIVFRE
jgi:hypothetical protein